MDSLEGLGRIGADLEDLVSHIDDMVALATLEGKLLYVNRAWREKLGYTEEEIASLSSYQIIHPVHDDDVRATNEKLRAGEELVRVERTLVAKNGEHFQVEGSISCRFRDGKPWYVRAIFHDITARKQAERMKDELVSMASHELRNPLMAIQTSLQIAREDLAKPGLERPLRMLDLAISNSHKMLDLVNVYLDLARLESEGVALRRLELGARELVERAVELNQPLGARAGVALHLDAPDGARVVGDEDRLAQVLTNLISNAIKFSKPGGVVRVSARRRDGGVRISVSDQGEGIPDEFRDKVFGKFAQAEGHKRGGSGLGLAISKTIVERHGGRIGFDTELGRGTTFWFELPDASP